MAIGDRLLNLLVLNNPARAHFSPDTYAAGSQALLASSSTLSITPDPVKMLRLMYAAAFALSTASAFDCSAKELSQYDFQSIKGEYSDSLTRNTPPSHAVFTWTIGVCQSVQKQADCPKNSDVCGTTRIKVDNKDTLSELISFDSSLQKTYTRFGAEGTDQENGIDIAYKGVKWGDLLVDGSIKFICASKDDATNTFKLLSWNGSVFNSEFRSPAACINSNKSGKTPSRNKHDSDNGESWGWFTWIFIFVVLFLSIYIIGGAWFQYHHGNAIDFQSALKEVVVNFVDLLRGLPAFMREVVEKVTGNSNRGEYSAV